MKKVFLNCMLLLCALIVGSGDLWADESTVDITSLGTQTWKSYSLTSGVVTIATDLNSGSAPTTSSAQYRWKTNNIITISVSTGNIVSIQFVTNSTGAYGPKNLEYGGEAICSSGTSYTWEAPSTMSSASFTVTSETRLTEIHVTYDASGAAVSSAAITFNLSTNIFGFPTSSTTGENSYSYNGYTITLNAGNGYYYNTTDKYLILGKLDATLTFPAFSFNVNKIKIYGRSGASGKVTFNMYEGSDAVSTEVTGSTTDHEFEIAAANQDAGTIYTLKVTNGNNCQITKIEIFGYAAITMNEYGWMSYNNDYPLELGALPDDLTAYQIEAGNVDVSNELVTLSSVTSAVVKNTGLLLKGTPNGEYEIPLVSTGTSISETNKLVAVTENNTSVAIEGGYDKYVLCVKNSEAVLAKIEETSATLSKGQAYLKLASPSTPAPAIIRLEQDDNNATDIQSIESSDKATKFFRDGQIFFLRNGITYDALGRVVR